MSMLAVEIHRELTQLLHGLQSSDNVVRTQAEESLESQWVQPRVDMLLVGLVEQMLGAEDTAVRLACLKIGVLCRLYGNRPVRTPPSSSVAYRPGLVETKPPTAPKKFSSFFHNSSKTRFARSCCNHFQTKLQLKSGTKLPMRSPRLRGNTWRRVSLHGCH